MGHGHGGGFGLWLSVDFGVVAVDDGFLMADEPLAPDGKSAEAAGLGQAGGLQEWQAAAAGSDEDKAGGDGGGSTIWAVGDGHLPAAGGRGQCGDAAVC